MPKLVGQESLVGVIYLVACLVAVGLLFHCAPLHEGFARVYRNSCVMWCAGIEKVSRRYVAHARMSTSRAFGRRMFAKPAEQDPRRHGGW